MKRSNLNLVIAASTVVLSIISLLVEFDGAAAEPYIAFHWWDAIVQIGFAVILMLLWFVLAGGIIMGVVRRRICVCWLLLLVWAFMCERSLFASPSGYIHDITHYVAESH